MKDLSVLEINDQFHKGKESESCNHDVFLFNTDSGPQVFVVDGSRIYGIPDDVYEEIASLINAKGSTLNSFLEKLGVLNHHYITDKPAGLFPVKAVSLAIAQKCNLSCAYCYAQEGRFGGDSKNMELEVAIDSVKRLFKECSSGDRVNLAFMGGEPLVNRSVLYAATEFAHKAAKEEGVKIGYSITTNGTLINPEDGGFFEKYGFAVSISLDGIGKDHDRTRQSNNGQGSYKEIVSRIKPLLQMQRNMQVSARVTVTPLNLNLRETLNEFIGLGFHSVGFSPMLNSPNGKYQMESRELDIMLGQMIECGQGFEEHVIAGKRYPFFNMVSAMQEIHKGTHRPYPCGAGAGYLGVSADGDLYACHRFVNDEDGAMGSIMDGVNKEKQAAWLSRWHVHFQEPCKECWARYLCGGGCYYEVINRGRPACDYIRGWLHYCLQAYVRLLEKRPDYFGVQTTADISKKTKVKNDSIPIY